MKHGRNIILLVLLWVCYIPMTADIRITKAELDRELSLLDRSLNHRNEYIARRQARIDSLREGLDLSHPSPELIMRLGREYTSFNNDSALYYFDFGRKVATTKADVEQFSWSMAALMPLAGFFEKAEDIYNAIDVDSISPSLLPSYYDAGRQMHSYISGFYKSYPDVASIHVKKVIDLQLRLLELLPKNSPEYKYNLGEHYLLTGQKPRARLLLEEVFNHESPSNNLRAKAAHHLARLMLADGDENGYLFYMAASALADVNSATREVASLQELGSNLGNQDDVDRAHKYLSAALENAVECGAALRMIDTSRALPYIQTAHSEDIRRWQRSVLIIVGVLFLLLVGLVVVLRRSRLQMQKMKDLEVTLREANKTKEVYISQFLSLCSIYMDKLNQFCKIANRKLAAGQAEDLYRMTKSGKFVEEQSKEFYDVFDNAFLHIYPDFITKVNELLRRDSQIVLREGELLNTDLRILAFMRLGIDDSAGIAQILNYSLNTIYAYRNRLKARALNRDTFEEDIAKIEA